VAHRRDVNAMTSLVKAALALVLALASGCTLMLSGSAMDGRVVDSETGAPIPGALVIVEWKGDIGGPVQSSQVCFHLEVVTTDEEGRYHVPAWHRRPAADWEGGFYGVRNVDVSRRTYKSGYMQVKYEPQNMANILMRRFEGTPEQRIDYLNRLGTPSCGRDDGSRANELSLWAAICQEARTIPLARQSSPSFNGDSFLQDIDGRITYIKQRLPPGQAIPPEVLYGPCHTGRP